MGLALAFHAFDQDELVAVFAQDFRRPVIAGVDIDQDLQRSGLPAKRQKVLGFLPDDRLLVVGAQADRERLLRCRRAPIERQRAEARDQPQAERIADEGVLRQQQEPTADDKQRRA